MKGNVPRPWSLLLTQPVAGGIGIVALGGASRQRILQTIFRHKKGGPLPHPRPGRLYYGIIHDRGEEIDEAILEAGADFDCLHIHGGAATAGALRELLSRHGAKPLPPEKYWEKRFPHPQQILLREWHRLLLAAPTEEFLHLILAQPLAWKNLADRWPPPPEELREISRRVRLRTIMQHPPVIALAGLPNAGKSSLFNRLLEEERSLVFDRPGTTRDPVAAATSLRGYPVTLVDCAGMEPGSGTKLGRQSTAMARRQMREADLVLWIHDGSRRDRIAPPARLPVLEMVSHGDRLSPAWIKRLAEEPRLPAYSALTGKGEKTVEELLLKQLKLPPLPEEPLPLPFSRDLRKLLRSPGRRVPACLSVFLAGTKLR